MYDFLIFFNELVKRFPMHLEITYDKHTDWVIYIYKKGCANDYPNSVSVGNDAVIVSEQSIDIDLCFAEALVSLKRWMLEHNDGY
jgi:hypothetical protein